MAVPQESEEFMRRREFVGALTTAGFVGTAGCGTAPGEVTLSEPSVLGDSPGRESLQWSTDGESVANFGVTGNVATGIVDLSTELSHRDGTDVTRIELRVRMPDAGSATDVAVVSPVEGDSSPPPSVTLYTPENATGTAIEVTDLDDLAEETINTLDLIVRPRETATELAIDATIELTEGGVLGDDYTLNGELDLSFPELAGG